MVDFSITLSMLPHAVWETTPWSPVVMFNLHLKSCYQIWVAELCRMLNTDSGPWILYTRLWCQWSSFCHMPPHTKCTSHSILYRLRYTCFMNFPWFTYFPNSWGICDSYFWFCCWHCQIVSVALYLERINYGIIVLCLNIILCAE